MTNVGMKSNQERTDFVLSKFPKACVEETKIMTRYSFSVGAWDVMLTFVNEPRDVSFSDCDAVMTMFQGEDKKLIFADIVHFDNSVNFLFGKSLEQ